MIHTRYPVIDLPATGRNIKFLRESKNLTVRDLQAYFGFEQPQAIYKWQNGQCLPTVDNLYALSALFGVPMNSILVPVITPAENVGLCPQASAGGVFFVRTSYDTRRIGVFQSTCR